MITFDDVERARGVVAPHVITTPVMTSRTLSARLGTTVHLKLELFQRTGSFKPRGAVNQLLGLDADARRGGVVGVSGGNFAQGLAYAGAVLGVKTLVVMPADTPTNYVEATRSYGAQVELVPSMEEAFAAFERHGEEGWTAVHPFDNADMMAGNGTLGLEVAEQVPDVTDVVVSIGGGGFMTGVATALAARRPGVRIWGVETEGADVMARSLAAGEQIRITPTSVARTLAAPYAAADAITAAQTLLQGVTVVPDREAVAAMVFLLERTKVLTEPAAACTVAAADALREQLVRGGHLVLILCGGNVSVADLTALTARFMPGYGARHE